MTIRKGSDWNFVLLSGQGSIGVGVSTLATLGATYGKGNVSFFNNQNVGKPKTTLEIYESLVKIFFAPGL